MTSTTRQTDRLINRAPKGGAISPINGRFYKGGQFMPMAGAEIKPTRVEIKGATYEVRAIDPGFAGVAAVEVRKFNGESYAVTLQADGRAVCECPSYLYTHEDRGTCCKHGLAVIEAGLLRAPAPAVVIEPGLVPAWEPELAGDDESAFGTAPAGADRWDALALRLAA